MKLRHFLLFFLLLQMTFPVTALILGDPAGMLVGALIAAGLTPLVTLALRAMRQFLLRLIEERVGQLAPLARAGDYGAPSWLPFMRTAGRFLVRGLSPVSFVMLLVCLSGMLPDLFYMLFTFLQVLYLLAIFALAALVTLGETHPDLFWLLVRALFRQRQRHDSPANPVIIVTDAFYEATSPGIPSLGYQPVPLLLAQSTTSSLDEKEKPGEMQTQERS
jgi:hypothetical protein